MFILFQVTNVFMVLIIIQDTDVQFLKNNYILLLSYSLALA